VIKSRRKRWPGHVADMGERQGAHRVFVGKLEKKKLLGRPKGVGVKIILNDYHRNKIIL
jgi:hypothetical protein